MMVLQVADALSCLALQRPMDVVNKLVDSAVESRGHIECVIKLLLRLPTLAQITADDGHSVLLRRLDQQIVSCSPQMLQNIANFCRLLLVSASSSSLPVRLPFVDSVTVSGISCAYRKLFSILFCQFSVWFCAIE